MKFDIYQFNATEDGHGDREYTFKGYLLPTGEVLCPEDQTNDSFYESLDAVQAHGLAFVKEYEKTGETIEFTDDELRKSIKGSAREFGESAIPESLLHWLTSYEIQAKGQYGDWDSGYVSGDHDATLFETEAEAEQAIEELRRLGDEWANGEYRIVEVRP